MSPSKLQPAPEDITQTAPLDLTKKKAPAFTEPLATSSDDAETGEEKPTDYSLRYQESEDSELLAVKDSKSEQLFDDTVKTYYTEGTPMDTPFMFSTATSMNDLREPTIAEDEAEEKKVEENIDSTVAYAVEGTPLTFSRAESLSDLEGEGEREGEASKLTLTVIPEQREEKAMTETAGEKREQSKTPPLKDVKTVTFRPSVAGEGGAAGPGRNPHETPLMFSRASSIASLDSFEQQSVQDGYSSYEASRATSGRVSPSDLPDSPSQTMPASPGPQPRPTQPVVPPLAARHKVPVFEDGVKNYQEEGTPAVFSTRTSLSGLEFDQEETQVPENEKSSTISEDEDIYADSESLLGQLINSAMPNSKPPKSRLPKPKQAWQRSQSPQVEADGAAGSDDSCASGDTQDMLAACIASAMPSKTVTGRTNRLGPRLAAEGAPAEPVPRPGRASRPPAPPERRGSHLSHPCVAAAAAAVADYSFPGGAVAGPSTLSGLAEEEPRGTAARSGRSVPPSGGETPLRFMTEGTPAVFSRNDSLSSLDVSCDEASVNGGQFSKKGAAVCGSRGGGLSSVTASSPGSFQSHLPRPSALGRSASSGSSSGRGQQSSSAAAGPNPSSQDKSFNSSLSSLSIESLDNTNAAEEDLLADCISSAMPKSKSEHYDLAGAGKKSRKSPGREKAERQRVGSRQQVDKVELGQQQPPVSLDLTSSVSSNSMWDASPNCTTAELPPDRALAAQPGMEETLTQSRVSSLELASLTQSGLDEARQLAECVELEQSEAVEDIGPPSLMLDSGAGLPSLTTERPSPAHLPGLGAKLGSSVPLTVRRALGSHGPPGSQSAEDLSSLSSCLSNIEHVAPPSLLEDLDMDNSMVSVASIGSEFGSAMLAGSAGSTGSAGLSSEAIREIREIGAAVERFSGEECSVSQQLQDILAPTVMEDLTDLTLVAAAGAGATYTLQQEEPDTIADICTDALDEESVVEPTLTAGSDAVECAEVPELPRDSAGESSLESTPNPRRKLSPKETAEMDKYRTFTKEESPRKAGRGDSERFRTRTITKEDLTTDQAGSPRSAGKQRRAEDAARFLTQTICPADVRPRPGLTAQEAELLQSEAQLVVQSLELTEPASKSRSASVEILGEDEMPCLEAEEVNGPGRPRICKPWESRVASEDCSPSKGVRGRRRPLYSPPMKRATVPPPVAPKPVVAARVRAGSSPATSPRTAVRGTRATALRQARVASPVSATSPSPRSPAPPALVRQGTFTKDEETASNTSQSRVKSAPTKSAPKKSLSSVSAKDLPKKVGPKTAAKPALFNRKDAVQPSPTRSSLTVAGTTKTQTLREKSLSRGGPVRSSTSSSSSVVSKSSMVSRTSIRTSTSSHSLRAAAGESALPRRVPSSSDIERRKAGPGLPGSSVAPQPGRRAVTASRSASTPDQTNNPAPPTARRNVTGVTSKIASLWKKVEESKQKSDLEKSAKKYKPKDKRIWISRGKSESGQKENAADSPGKLIRSGTYEKINASNDTILSARSETELKPRSKSRLSMKLSKFSLKRRSDQVNGNTAELVSPTSPGSLSPGSDPDTAMSTGPDLEFSGPARKPASAIVAPFNYVPTVQNQNEAGPGAVQLKRNTSYVSSIGRRREEGQAEQAVDPKSILVSNTSSTMVTLV